MEYLFHILIMIGIYSIATMSLNVMAGYSGLLSLSHAAFYGMGAYTTAILSLKLGLPILVTIPLGCILAVIISLLVAIPSLRTHDDYFVITTFGLQVIAFGILNNWVGLTNGPMGIAGIARPFFARDGNFRFLIFVTVSTVITWFCLNYLARSPFGRVLRAIREDEILTESFGKDVMQYKFAAFAVSACGAAFAGSLYACYISFIDPTSFTIMESVFMLSIVIIGGAGNLAGSIIGSAILIFVPEILRFIGLPNSIAANFRQIFYGILLVVFLYFKPQGIMCENISSRGLLPNGKAGNDA